jgi:hypothetical protein
MSKIIWDTFIIIFIMTVIIACLIYIGYLIKNKNTDDVTTNIPCLNVETNKIGEFNYETDVNISNNKLFCDTCSPNQTLSNGIITYYTTDEKISVDFRSLDFQNDNVAIPNPKYYTKK